MNKLITHLKTEWYKYGLETLVVILGILVAFALNNWNEERKQSELAQKYLHALYDDIIHNNHLMDHAIEQMEGTKRATRSLAVFIDSGFVVIDGAKSQVRMDEEFYKNFGNHTNDYIPISDTVSLIYNLNRSGWVTSYDLILPAWNELISSGNIQLIKNKTLKEEIVMLFFMAGEIEELETKIMTPIVKDYKAMRAKYYNVSKSTSGPVESYEEGLFGNDALVDIDALRTSKEVKYQLKLVYRAANEQQQNIRENVGWKSAIIFDLLKEELKDIL